MAVTVERHRLDVIDALRGVAILTVVTGHFGYTLLRGYELPGPVARVHELLRVGWLGVDLFFVLSGFLITSLLLERRERKGYYRDFYVRRALRILPLYSLLLLVLAISGIAPLSFVFLSIFFVANFAGTLPAGNPYGILWSLAIEEQFYLFWPTVVRHVTPRKIGLVGAGVLIASPLLRLVAFSQGADANVLYYVTPFHLDGLAMGVVIAALAHGPRSSKRRLGGFAIGAAALGALLTILGVRLGILHRETPVGAALQFTVVALIFGAVVVGGLLVSNPTLRRLVAPRILRFYGDISYGLYLIHVLTFTLLDLLIRAVVPRLAPSPSTPGLAVAEVAVAFLLATGIAFVSRRHFEERFLRLKEKLVKKVGPTADVREPEESLTG